MIPENNFPASNGHPAADIDRVVARVSDLIAKEGPYSLIGCQFKDMAQFRQALVDTGFSDIVSQPCMKDQPEIAETLCVSFAAKDGSKWESLVNVWNALEVEVMNVKRLSKNNIYQLSAEREALIVTGPRMPVADPAGDLIEQLIKENEEEKRRNAKPD
jgi:hypothetical protein